MLSLFFPRNAEFSSFVQFVQERLPPECPQLFGIHPNAEIGSMTTVTDTLTKSSLTLHGMQSAVALPAAASVTRISKVLGGGAEPPSESAVLLSIVRGLLSRLPSELALSDVQVRRLCFSLFVGIPPGT